MANLCSCNLKGSIEVPYKGVVSPVVLMGNWPNLEEELEGVSFHGEWADLLNTELERAGLVPAELLYINAIRCHVDKKSHNKKEIAEILASCRRKVTTAIESVRPAVIVTLGGVPLLQLTGSEKVTPVRGKFIWMEEFNCYVFPIWSPKYILKAPNKIEELREDIKQLSNFVRNDYEIPNESTITHKEVESIREFLDLEEENKCTAIDTETQGLSWYDPNSIIISYSLSVSNTEGWNVFLQEEVPIDQADYTIIIERGGTKKEPIKIEVGIKRADNYDAKVEELRELCGREDIKKYFMNYKFDKHRIYNLGVTEINNVPIDIAVAAHVLDSERFTNATLGDIYNKLTPYKTHHKDDFSKAEKSDMLLQAATQRELFNRYACMDAVVTLRAALEIIKHLERDYDAMRYFIKFAMPVETELLFEIERNGIEIAEEKIPEIEAECKQKILEYEAEFKKYCPEMVHERHAEKFKMTRRIIMSEALFAFTDKEGDTLDFGFGIDPLGLSRKTGLPVVDKTVLEKLLGTRKTPAKAKKLIRAYKEWSAYTTIMTRYINNIKKTMVGGVIYPSYSITYTTSGRTGARRPSIQNFPKRGPRASLIRGLLKAAEGTEFIEADYVASELKFVAHVSGDPVMKQAFIDKKDIHMQTGIRVSGVKNLAGMSKDQLKKVRQSAKACIAEGQLVLTDFGLVPIEEVTIHHRVWDGIDFVVHEGVIFKGVQEVISYDGLIATEDHKAWTKEGRTISLGELASSVERGRIIISGDGEIPIRIIDFDGEDITEREEKRKAYRIPMLSMRSVTTDIPFKYSYEENNWMQVPKKQEVSQRYKSRYSRGPLRCSLSKVYESEIRLLQPVWRTWDQMSVPEQTAFYRVGISEFATQGLQRSTDRQREQQWELRTGKSPISYSETEFMQYSEECIHTIPRNESPCGSYMAFIKDRVSKISVRPKTHSQIAKERTFDPANFRQEKRKDWAKVYDIVNAGPRHRFTVSNMLVANCNFGLIYGMGLNGFVKYAENDYGVKLSKKQASVKIDKFFGLYANLKDWHVKTRNFLRQHGYIRSMYGRKRTLAGLYSADDYIRSKAERVGLNFEIQGPSSDHTLLGGLNIVRDPRYKEQGIKIRAFIHDAFIYQVHDREPAMPFIKEEMEHVDTTPLGAHISVPMDIEMSVGETLSEMEDL